MFTHRPSPVAPPARHLAAARLAACVAAILLGACGGGGGSTPPPPVNTNASAIAASLPGELLATVKSTLAARQALGLSNNAITFSPDLVAGVALATTSSGEAVARSNTTVQEAGVDEEDLLKSDGDLILALDTLGRSPSGFAQSRLQLHRRGADGRLQALQTLALPADEASYPTPRGMLLASLNGGARRVAVLSESISAIGVPVPCPPGAACIATTALIYPPQALKSEVRVQQVEVTAAGVASLGSLAQIDGRLMGSRQIGNQLYLVTTHSPRLAADLLPLNATTAEREAALALLKVADVLPMLRINGGAPQPLVAETDCYAQPKNASLDLAVTAITAIDLSTPNFSRSSRCFVGGTEAMYMSTASIYLATTRQVHSLVGNVIRYAPQTTTDIHKFSVSGAAINYRASGEITGHLGWDAQRKPYRFSEHNGDLRVLSFTGEFGWGWLGDASSPTAPPPSPATLSVLRESGASLQLLAMLPNAQRPAAIGLPGEQIYAVRFAGDRGYVVTFRRSDPLYVLDLSVPADPRQAGALVIPGFSDYLFPMGDGLLFGAGKDADALGRVGGVKVALFDVRDIAAPKTLATQVFGDSGSQSALDYSSHGISLFTRGNVVRVALPVSVARTTGFTSSWQQSLQRFEVDTAARSLTTKTAVPSPGTQAYPDLWSDRALQIESQVYYLSQGQLVGVNW